MISKSEAFKPAIFGMNNSSIITIVVFLTVLLMTGCREEKKKPETLKEVFQDKFLMGTAINTFQAEETDTASVAIIKKHFNSIVAENCMKSEKIQPEQGVFTFGDADNFVAFGEKYNMNIIGHTLIWHSQAPAWFFVDKEGKDVSRDTLIARMENHISTLMGRYKGRVDGWDVVNEAFEDDGQWRKSKFYEIIGEDYVRLAFEFAREADPEAELYYNDFSMAKSGRKESVIKLIKDLQKQGIKVDGIGLQGHFTMTYPTIEEYEAAIADYSKLGVSLMITEMDLTVLPWPSDEVTAEISTRFELKDEYNPYPDGLPDSASMAHTNRYLQFFRIFDKYSDHINRVTVWGVNDAQSWRNYWPIVGRRDYPVLFDRDNKPKPIVDSLLML